MSFCAVLLINGNDEWNIFVLIIGSILKSDRKQKISIYTVQITYKLTKIFPKKVIQKGYLYCT